MARWRDRMERSSHAYVLSVDAIRSVVQKEVSEKFPALLPILAQARIRLGSGEGVSIGVLEGLPEIVIGTDTYHVYRDESTDRAVILGPPRLQESLISRIIVALFQMALGHAWRGEGDTAFHLASDTLVYDMVDSRAAIELQRRLMMYGIPRDVARTAITMAKERQSVEHIAAVVRPHIKTPRIRKGRSSSKDRGQRSGFLVNWPKQKPKNWRQLKNRFVEAYNHARMTLKSWGSEPGNSTERVSASDGRISWKRKLKKIFRRIAHDNVTYARPDKRLLHAGIVLPGYVGGRAKVAAILDTSGSIDSKDLSRFLGEVQRLARTYDVRGWLIQADVRVQSIEPIQTARKRKTFNVYGRGGTSFVEALETADNLKVDHVIYFTDLEGEYPQRAPKTPVTWVSTTAGGAPFGEVIIYDADAQRR